MRDRERKIVRSRDTITVVDNAPKRGVRSKPVTRPGIAVPDADAEYRRVMGQQEFDVEGDEDRTSG